MINRVLLKEIPHGKFHSAIFTTYSINLYYFEQQVLPLLGSKDIHYISVLADGNMLSNQLNEYSQLSVSRKRNYSIHGIQCNGAFHPKIIFLVGESSILLLLGSGNLTTSGHGKNLETWNAIFIDNQNDIKFGLIIQAWNYLKQLHFGLGDSANNKLQTIEENCFLFRNFEKIVISNTYQIDNENTISFLATNSEKSLFNQLVEIIGNENIKKITIQSPFYDTDGKFIDKLYEHFQPNEINIYLQKKFGSYPKFIKPKSNLNFFYWENNKQEEIKQSFFHAKNIVFEGNIKSYLLTGSANASFSAFLSNGTIINHEACILYQKNNFDFNNFLGLKLTDKILDVAEFQNIVKHIENLINENNQIIFIKAIEKNYNELMIYISSKLKVPEVKICFFNGKGELLFEKENDIEQGEAIIKLTIPSLTTVLYGVVFDKSNISNKQFVIDINAFESTNPSPRNRSLNQIKKLIENGNFSSPKIIEYLNTIYKQSDKNKIVGSSKSDIKSDTKIIEEENDLLYLPYEEIQKKARNFEEIQKGKGYIEYKSVRLWESIFLYLKEAKQKEEQAKIDEEETENINTSTGRAEVTKMTSKKMISKSNFDRLKEKVEKFLVNYCKILENNIIDDYKKNQKIENPNIIDLSMYLIILEILLHLLNHKELVEDKQSVEKTLLQIQYADYEDTWSEFVIKIIGLFTLWCSQKGGFKEIDNEEYKLKLELYKQLALKTSVGTLALFSIINKNDKFQRTETWVKLNLLNVNRCFNSENIVYKEFSKFVEFVPKDSIDDVGEVNLNEEILLWLNTINQQNSIISKAEDNEIYLHPVDGYTIINKITLNSKNSNIKYLKLFHTGYNKYSDNYWNEKLFSVNELKWFKVRTEY